MSRNIFLNRSDFSRELKALWRIKRAVTTAQLLGALISFFVAPYGFAFIDLWFGGAIASLPGFILGLIWQLKAVPDTLPKHKPLLLISGALASTLTISAFVLPMKQFAAQARPDFHESK